MPVTGSVSGLLSTTVRVGLIVSPSITTTCSSLPMSSMIMAISSSPTRVRASLNESMRSASPTWACSNWVCSCRPERAVPCWPEKAGPMLLTRSRLRRLLSISWNCWSLSWKSRLTSNRAPGRAIFSSFRMMSASGRATMRRNESSGMSTAPLVRSTRVALMPQRSLAMELLRLSCGKSMSRTRPNGIPVMSSR